MVDNRCWYHLIVTTYGSWLYGDRRGFRTRHHREHVEGDYKNPPPASKYAELEQRSRKSLKQPPVKIPKPLRPVVGLALKERLEGLGGLVVAVAVCGHHVHVLAKIAQRKGRAWMGKAKLHVWFTLRQQHGWQGKLWGKRGKTIPVLDRQHQLHVYQYILDHVRQSGWIWKWSDRTKGQTS
jgi:hypothetical protein